MKKTRTVLIIAVLVAVGVAGIAGTGLMSEAIDLPDFGDLEMREVDCVINGVTYPPPCPESGP